MTTDVKITISFNEDVELDEVGSFISDEFLEYKKLSITDSADNFITPNEQIQHQTESIHSLFGRDRVFDYPVHLSTHIHYENLTHVHVDKDNTWGAGLTQWACTSKYSIVYSGFTLTNNHIHLIVHDLLINKDGDADFDAHNFYNNDDVEYYINSAAYYRKEEIKKSK